MDAIDFGCLIIKSSLFDLTMGPIGYFGHGMVGVIISLALLASGFFRNDRRLKQIGLAVLLAIMASGLLAHLLKLGLQMPRPTLRASYGFPSGHATTAFSLAGALGIAFPGLSPLFYLLATLTGLSRLYFRAHFVWDVIGGALLGSIVGMTIAKKTLAPRTSPYASPGSYIGWGLTAAFGLLGVAFFIASEKTIASHRVPPPELPRSQPGRILMDFGSPEARSFLRYGWSGDEHWMDGNLSIAWAQGFASELRVPFPHPENYRVFLHLYPFMPKGPACQRIEISVNDVPAARLHLEKGWNWYELKVPKRAIKSEMNDIQFYFDRAESPRSLGLSSDERPLSVAFDSLLAVPEK